MRGPTTLHHALPKDRLTIFASLGTEPEGELALI
jgi:hypothetical protein